MRTLLSALACLLGMGALYFSSPAFLGATPAPSPPASIEESSVKEPAGGEAVESIKDLVQTWVIQGTGFVLLMGVLWILLKKPLPRLLAQTRQDVVQRYQTLEEQLATAHQSLKEARQQLQQFESTREAAFQEALRRNEGLAESIQRETGQILKTLEERVDDEMAFETEKAKKEIRHAAVVKAVALTRQTLASSVTETTQERLVQGFLKKLETVETHPDLLNGLR